MKRSSKWLVSIAAVGFGCSGCLAQNPTANSVIGALNKAERAQKESAARRAEAAQVAKQRALDSAKAIAAAKKALQESAAARQAAIRRSDEARRKAVEQEVARKAAMEVEETARRQVLQEAEQRAAELRQINDLNAKNRRTELQQKASSGDAQAALDLARIYEVGEYVQISAADAAIWYKVAAGLGNSDAQMRYVKSASSDNNSRGDPLVLKYLLDLSATNHPEAQFILSKKYADGIGVPLDKQRSLALLKSAADAGLLEAQEEIGKVLQDGSFEKKDFVSSIRYLKSAAAQGSITANFNIGIAYEYGLGVPKDNDLAYGFYKKVYRSGGKDGILDRLKSVDSFSYSGKDYNIIPRKNLDMYCPSVNARIKFENGLIKENNDGAYLEYGSVKKENGRNVFKYGVLIKTIVDFDQRKYVVLLGGKRAFNCE